MADLMAEMEEEVLTGNHLYYFLISVSTFKDLTKFKKNSNYIFKYYDFKDGGAKQSPSTFRQQSALRRPTTPINPSSSHKPMIHSQPSTSTTTFSVTTNDAVSSSSSSTEPKTSTTFQQSNATGRVHCLHG